MERLIHRNIQNIKGHTYLKGQHLCLISVGKYEDNQEGVSLYISRKENFMNEKVVINDIRDSRELKVKARCPFHVGKRRDGCPWLMVL